MNEPASNAIDAAIHELHDAETARNLARETLKQALEDADAADKHVIDMQVALREAVKARCRHLIGSQP